MIGATISHCRILEESPTASVQVGKARLHFRFGEQSGSVRRSPLREHRAL